MAQTNTIFKIFNVIIIWIGITLIIRGLDIQNKSNYRPPTTPVGWVMGMAWIGIGAMIATIWVLFIAAAHIDQMLQQKPRWTRTRILASGLVLFAAAVFAVIGTYSTWKHPFLLTPCDCLDSEWGKLCTPCNCGDLEFVIRVFTEMVLVPVMLVGQDDFVMFAMNDLNLQENVTNVD